MLRSLKALEGYSVNATDGDIGRVVNFLVDDERWVVRYLVAEIGVGTAARHVLISPISFRDADWETHRFHLTVTNHKVTHSPEVDLAQPVSREQEAAFHRYYGYPYYWGYAGPWGVGVSPSLLAGGAGADGVPRHFDTLVPDAHLRSATELRGYHVQGTDGGIGHIDDFVVDDETWQVRYLAIDTSNWWFGKKVLISPAWATHVSSAQKDAYFGLSRQAIKESPEWNASAGVNREYETRLYDYYGRPAYWETDHAPHEAPSRQSVMHPR